MRVHYSPEPEQGHTMTLQYNSSERFSSVFRATDTPSVGVKNNKKEEASIHKSAKTHASIVFVLRTLDLLTPK